MASPAVAEEHLPPALTSASEQPPFFDGNTRLYTHYPCPFAQRVWITRNYKVLGLQDQIKPVPINLQDRPPDWYKEKVYPPNKVPALEHNGKIIGESLDLIKYVDAHYDGPSLQPQDPEKNKFAKEMNWVLLFQRRPRKSSLPGCFLSSTSSLGEHPIWSFGRSQGPW